MPVVINPPLLTSWSLRGKSDHTNKDSTANGLDEENFGSGFHVEVRSHEAEWEASWRHCSGQADSRDLAEGMAWECHRAMVGPRLTLDLSQADRIGYVEMGESAKSRVPWFSVQATWRMLLLSSGVGQAGEVQTKLREGEQVGVTFLSPPH